MSPHQTRCAAGLLLFGGTLGLASPAGAGVQVGDMYVFEAYASFAAGTASFSSFNMGTLKGGASASDGTASLTMSPWTPSGFSVTASSSGGSWTLRGFEFDFVADNVNRAVVLSGSISASAAQIYLYSTTTQTMLFSRTVGDGGNWSSGPLALSNGHGYALWINAAGGDGPGGVASMESGTVLGFAVVPAPGVAAMLMLSGLCGSRRRS
ncbi:MAG: hypothetical protein EBQ99_05445 [Planctomycetes bacterium]|nr:hypothetical protein [Planctomycetota bacterium]